MTDYANMSLSAVRRDYLVNTTTAMPIAGLISWFGLSIALFAFPYRLPYWSPFVAAALPVPLALLIDTVRGAVGTWRAGNTNPITQLFMRSIWVVTLLTPLLIIAVQQSGNADLLVLGMGILAGVVWVPHGWGADDPAGLVHFVMRAIACYAAFLLAPDSVRGPTIAAVVAMTYVYAIIAMKKPGSAGKR